MALVYKVVSQQDWKLAQKAGVILGAPVDLRDGYIHLSSGEQLKRTVELHFSDCEDLVLVAFEAARLGDALRWEPSRDGALFPHFYGTLPLKSAEWSSPFSALDLDSIRRLSAGGA